MRYLLNKIFSHKSINCTLFAFCAQYILTFEGCQYCEKGEKSRNEYPRARALYNILYLQKK